MVRPLTLPLPTLLLALTLGACGASRAPVPLVGQSADVSALTGDWSGDYSSAESGRSGSNSFTMRATGYSALGDVVVVTAALGRPRVACRQENAHGGTHAPGSTVLTI